MNDFTIGKIEDKAEEYYQHRYAEQDAFIEGAKWMWNNQKIFLDHEFFRGMNVMKPKISNDPRDFNHYGG